jgi:sulfatase-like protein
MDQAKKDGKPFFIWHNMTRMHVFTYIAPKYQVMMNYKSNYGLEEAGMAQLDDDIGDLLKHLRDIGEADNTIVIFTTDNGAEVFTWPDGALAMQKATEATVLGDFGGARFEHFGVTTTFFRDGGKFMVRTARYAYVYAVALNSTGATGEALALLEGAHQRHPADRNVLTALVSIARDNGDFAAALGHRANCSPSIPGTCSCKRWSRILKRRRTTSSPRDRRDLGALRLIVPQLQP